MRGAHSGGFRITVFPAARAGATRHVASISGAFHGVITAVGPARIPRDALAVPVDLGVRRALQGEQAVGERPEVAGDPRHHRVAHRPQERAVVAGLDRGEVGHARLDAVGDPVQDGRAVGRGGRPPPVGGLARGADRRGGIAPARRAPPRRSGVSSIGDTSVNRSADATRTPPIQWSVETSTPSMTVPSPVADPPSVVRVRTVWSASHPVKPDADAHGPAPRPKWFDTRREPDVPGGSAPRRHEVRRGDRPRRSSHPTSAARP